MPQAFAAGGNSQCDRQSEGKSIDRTTELSTRLNALDALSSKGVHSDPSIDEARTHIAQTYLLAADLLSIAEGTSYRLNTLPRMTRPVEPKTVPDRGFCSGGSC